MTTWQEAFAELTATGQPLSLATMTALECRHCGVLATPPLSCEAARLIDANPVL